jgi:hypothetical protein
MKRNRTAAEKRARRERRKNNMIVFINGKQKRVPRPQLIEGLPVDEFIARNADPIWLHQNELWELMTPADETGWFTEEDDNREMIDADDGDDAFKENR